MLAAFQLFFFFFCAFVLCTKTRPRLFLWSRAFSVLSVVWCSFVLLICVTMHCLLHLLIRAVSILLRSCTKSDTLATHSGRGRGGEGGRDLRLICIWRCIGLFGDAAEG